MRNSPRTATPLYRKLAGEIERQIGQGALRVGDKIPSVRFLRSQHKVSISTVLQAYFWLESRGQIEARARSGFYVRVPFTDLVPEPKFREKTSQPRKIGTVPLINDVLQSVADPGMFPLGAACPSPELFPTHKLNALLRRAINSQPFHSGRYAFSPGLESLRRQIARRSLDFGCNFAPNDILIKIGRASCRERV